MIYYVYVDYTTEEHPRPFYIGKGNKRRIKSLSRNEVHSYIKTKYGCKRSIVLETHDEDEAFSFEKQLISEHKTNMHRANEGHWGANLTDGGEGPTGLKKPPLSPEHRLAISQKLSGRSPWHKGLKLSEEHRKKISESLNLLHRKLTDTQRKRLIEVHTGAKRSEETKRKIKLARAKQICSEETRRKMSETRKGRTKSEEARQKMRKPRICKVCNIPGHYSVSCRNVLTLP